MNPEFCKETLEVMKKQSPLAMKVNHEMLFRAREDNMELHESLNMEYTVALNFLRGKDFYTGIKSLSKSHERP